MGPVIHQEPFVSGWNVTNGSDLRCLSGTRRSLQVMVSIYQFVQFVIYLARLDD